MNRLTRKMKGIAQVSEYVGVHQHPCILSLGRLELEVKPRHTEWMQTEFIGNDRHA